MRTALHGFAAPRFSRVADAFADCFEKHGEVGAALCLYSGGTQVVDLWAGLADRDAGTPWREDTLGLVFSSTKGVSAICAGMLVERGVLDFDGPVASVWPEFATNGKARISLRHVLSHRAGLPAVEGKFTLERALAWQPVVEALASQAPLWEPGTAHGYHVRSYGWLLGEVVRRSTGRGISRFLADEVAAPLGLELWIGLPEELDSRVAAIIGPEPPADPAMRALLEQLTGPDTLTGRAMTGPSDLFHYDAMWNTRALRGAELPSSNGIGTARALARLYAATIGEVGGIRLLRPETVHRMTRVESDGPDRVLHVPTRFGLGFMLPPALAPSARPGAFGHPGAGGSLAMADPEAGFALGYVMNRMSLGVAGDPRANSLVEAVYASLSAS